MSQGNKNGKRKAESYKAMLVIPKKLRRTEDDEDENSSTGSSKCSISSTMTPVPSVIMDQFEGAEEAIIGKNPVANQIVVPSSSGRILPLMIHKSNPGISSNLTKKPLKIRPGSGRQRPLIIKESFPDISKRWDDEY